MISIIIPTYNEADQIKTTIQRIWEYDKSNLVGEIIVADGGSTDNTVGTAETEGVKVVASPKKGRAAQMNHGASLATHEILYFLHADTIPPDDFSDDILKAVRNGAGAGCYRLKFTIDHWFLRANCWFTRFNVNAVRFGDQSLFVKKGKFLEAGGFCEKHVVLEDQEIIRRLRKITPFTILQRPVLTSARKYRENGIYKTQAIFFLIYFMYRLGYSQQRLLSTYKKLIRQDKL